MRCKGALAFRFILDDSSLCFVNCHLAAGQTQTSSRNNDVASIMESDVFPWSQADDGFVCGGDGSMILDHEFCILNGDLNYRIDTMGRDAVIKAIQSDNLSRLLERDQLLVTRRRNPTFPLRALGENPITFAPTYKYDIGSDTYDTSEKRRAPAWCDRVLFRPSPRIKQVDYRRHELRISDHRPVTAVFRVTVKQVHPSKRASTRVRGEERFKSVKEKLGREAKYSRTLSDCGGLS